ncbi:hypothetical protein ACFL54_08490 [Planctomycetota bacterium]
MTQKDCQEDNLEILQEMKRRRYLASYIIILAIGLLGMSLIVSDYSVLRFIFLLASVATSLVAVHVKRCASCNSWLAYNPRHCSKCGVKLK